MLRIGEAAKQFDISNRTLRYWEETGILKSTRTENGYRFYNDENVTRISQNNLHKRSGYRNFGFNNPSPFEGNPVYGYEMWVTIPDNFVVPEPLVKKRFDGGL